VICTFYSYKGGVGRSMALANVADILARAGLRVLMIDFDLEAPGLEQFFPVNHSEVRRHRGLLDLVLSYKHAMSVVAAGPEDDEAFRDLDSFILPVYAALPSGGQLHLLPAGQRGDDEQLARYALSLRTFDWQDFYFNWAGGTFFEWFRQSLFPGHYDVVLVDSRTGVTEMGGICAYQLADTIVMLCSSNHQNVEGTRNVVNNFVSPRVRRLRGQRPLQVIVAPARIEQHDDALIAGFRARFEQAFNDQTPRAFQQRGLSFWDLLIPYEPRYAFEEQVITDPARSEDRQQMAAAYQELVGALAALAESESALAKVVQAPAAQQQRVEPQYDIAHRFAAYDTFVAFSRDDYNMALQLLARLEAAGLHCWLDQTDWLAGAAVPEAVEEYLRHSRSCLMLLGPSGQGPWQNKSFRTMLTAQVATRDLRVVPVLLPDAQPDLPLFLADRQAIDLRSGLDNVHAIKRLRETIRAGLPPAPEIYSPLPCPYPGMVPFQESDAAHFFGREKEIGQLVQMIRLLSFVMVIGPSGCGKSSLIFAGLLPQLRASTLFPSDYWLIRALRPGPRAMAELAHALGTKEQTLRFNPVGEIVTTALTRAPGARRLLLIIDQLEELFVQALVDERLAFFAALTALRTADSCTVLFSVRADFYPDLMNSPLWPIPSESRIEIAPLRGSALREAILRPAQQVGVAIDQPLIERLLADAADEPGVLPLIQETLVLLWERHEAGWLRLSAYEGLSKDGSSGLAFAIAYRANMLLDNLTLEQQSIARRIFLRLVQFGEGRADTRRQLGLSALRSADENLHLFDMTLRYLAQARLLTLSGDEHDGDIKVDIAHEALISSWPMLQSWITQRRESEMTRRRLAEKAVEWVRLGRSSGGLLDEIELVEAERWLSSLDASELGYDDVLAMLVQTSRARVLENTAIIRRRTRNTIVALMAVLVLVSILAISNGISVNNARAEASKAQAAQATAVAERERAILAQATAVAALTIVQSANGFATTSYSPDGKYLITATANGDARLLDIATRHVVAVLKGDGVSITKTAFRPDGLIIAIANARGIVHLWRVSDISDIREIATLVGHTGSVREVAFSPDGKLLATASDDLTVRLWDLPTESVVAILKGRSSAIGDIRFSPDGRTITTSSVDGSTQVWSETGALISSFQIP
jgi:Mrp family chromosome partitioning ATPase